MNQSSSAASDRNLLISDITTNDATTSKHGFLQKLPGGTTTFLRADGSFVSPPGGGAAAAYVATAETRASATYGDLTTTTDTVTVTVGASGRLLVTIGCLLQSGSGGFSGMSFALSGATTQAAADSFSIAAAITIRTGASFLLTGLTPGSTTVKAKYNSSTGTGTFTDRRISATPL